MSQTANRVIKNTGYLYAKMAITMFVSLYTTRLILNSLGASDFGIYNIVGGAIAMLGFLNVAMASATQRFMSYSEGEGNKEKQKYIFNISCVLHFCISIIIAIVLLAAGWFFFHGILNIPANRISAAQVVYCSLIVSTVFTVMNVPYDAVMNAHENMRYYAVVGILESFLKLVVAFVCVYVAGDKLVIYGILMAAIPFITLTIMKVYCHRHYEECIICPRKYWDKGLMMEMASFAGWNFITSFTSIVSQYGLGIVLNHFWGTLLNTAQGIANQLSGQLMTFSNSMLKALNPVITKSKGSGDVELMFKASFSGCKYAYLMLIIFSVPFIFEMPFILKLWLVNIPGWAVLFCRLQLLRSITEQLTITIGSVISANGNIKSYSIYKSILSILPILLTYVSFYFSFPPYTMYIVWILCGGVLGGFLALYYAKKLCDMRMISYLKDVLLPCIGTTSLMCLGAFVVVSILSPSFTRLCLLTIVTTVLLVLALLVCSTKEERMMMNAICNKIKKHYGKSRKS